MVDVKALWAEILPEVRNGVTGVGVWTALNKSQAITLEESTFVLGIPYESSDLAGHLRLQQTRTLIERMISTKLNSTIHLRVIEGVEQDDWETVKRKDSEARKLQEMALSRHRAEVSARSNWDSVYEQISRKFAAIPNKSLPQNRAKFFNECIELIVESMTSIPVTDELGERNYARCLERISQYSEVPSVLVALRVIERSGTIG